ncbi:MAG: hypothetical protein QOF09_4439 [Alphaproteobacteria bacterium]|nr:hypothetical protein [Alphaproteobacteria bacterium]
MITSEELVRHAERCTQLAEICTDPAVAKTLRQLARDYRGLAAETPKPHGPIQMIGTERAR